MRYFDTSFLAPLILREATSERIAEFTEDLPGGDLVVSHWTRVEFASLLAREVRIGGLGAAAARGASSRFETMVERSFVDLVPNRNDFDRASDWLGHSDTGLRAGDALHLAVAGNRGADAIYSLDKRMIAAGNALGLPMSAGALSGYSD